MRVKPLPKSWLSHTIEYKAFTGQKDEWNKPVYDAPITINFVRVDESTIFSRDTTQTKIVANAVIFVDAVNSNPVPVFKEESKITFNSREMTLKKIIPCYHPQQNEVHHYELEVV